MTFINWRGSHGVETVDEFASRKEARAMLAEYNLAYGGGCYLSQRCTRDWRA